MGFKDLEEFTLFIKNCLGDIYITSEDKENMLKEIKDNPKKLLSVPSGIKEGDIMEIIKYYN